ncbi:MAG: hypothetical protein AAF797_10995 [Planctomycetota bacterium]
MKNVAALALCLMQGIGCGALAQTEPDPVAPHDADTQASEAVSPAGAAALTPEEQQTAFEVQEYERLKAELQEVRRATLLVDQQHYELETRIQTIKDQTPGKRPVQLVRLLDDLEEARDELADLRSRNVVSFANLQRELEGYRRQLAKKTDNPNFDLGPNQAQLDRVRERESSPQDDLSRQLKEFGIILEEEKENIEQFKKDIADPTARQAYLKHVQEVSRETNAKLDSVYDQWMAAYDTGVLDGGNPPPPPPGYAQRNAHRQTTAGGQAAGNANRRPVHAPNPDARRSETNNNKEQARILREQAAKETDPAMKKILNDQADKLDPPAAS